MTSIEKGALLGSTQPDSTSSREETPSTAANRSPIGSASSSSSSSSSSYETISIPTRHRDIINQIHEKIEVDGTINVSLDTKVEWVTKLLKGYTGSAEERAIRDVVLSVAPIDPDNGVTEALRQEMVSFILKMETGGDIYDFDELLQNIHNKTIREEIQFYVRSRLPQVNFAWLGDNYEGDFQVALMMGIREEKDRVFSFIRLVQENIEKDIEKLAQDVEAVIKRTLATILTPSLIHLPSNIREIGRRDSRPSDKKEALNILLKRWNIFVHFNYEECQAQFDKIQGNKRWIVASDLDKTAVTGPQASATAIPGHLDLVSHINEHETDDFFYALTARIACLENGTLKNLASKNIKKVSVRTGVFGDYLQIIRGYGPLSQAIADTKMDRFKKLLDQWSQTPLPQKPKLAKSYPPPFTLGDPKQDLTRQLRERLNQASTQDPFWSIYKDTPQHAYSQDYAGIPGKEIEVWAKLEFDSPLFPSPLDPDIRAMPFQIRMEDEEGNVYSKKGELLFQREQVEVCRSTDNHFFTRNEWGRFCHQSGRSALDTEKIFSREKKLVTIFRIPGIKQVVIKDTDGFYYDSDGNTLFRESVLQEYLGPDNQTVAYRLEDGSVVAIERSSDGGVKKVEKLLALQVNEWTNWYDSSGNFIMYSTPDGVMLTASTGIYLKIRARTVFTNPKRLASEEDLMRYLAEESADLSNFAPQLNEYPQKTQELIKILIGEDPLAFKPENRFLQFAGREDPRSFSIDPALLRQQELSLTFTNDDGELSFHLTLPENFKDKKLIRFTYQSNGKHEAIDKTKVYIQPIDEKGVVSKPVILIDLDFASSLSKKSWQEWKEKLAPYLKSDSDFMLYYFTREDDSQKDKVLKKVKALNLPEGPLVIQDSLGLGYRATEGRGKRAKARHLEDTIVRARLNGLPIMAVITDPIYGRQGTERAGVLPLTFPGLIDQLITLTPESHEHSQIKKDFKVFQEKAAWKEKEGDLKTFEWNLRINDGVALVHHDLDTVTIFDGPSAEEQEIKAYQGLGEGDVIFFQIFEFHFDEMGNKVFEAIKKAVENGATLYFLYDGLGSRVYPFFSFKEGFLRLTDLATRHKGKVFLLDQPILSDGGIVHVDHRKRVLIIRHTDWIGPDGRSRRIPLLLTKISGRNIEQSYHKNPPFPKNLKNSYRTLNKNKARYDATTWIWDQDFGEENMTGLIYALLQRTPDLTPMPNGNPDLVWAKQMRLIFFGGNNVTLPSCFKGRNYDHYKRKAQEVMDQLALLSLDKRIEWAEKTWKELQPLVDSDKATFSQWVTHHLAQNILIEDSLFFKPETYKQIYEDSIKKLENGDIPIEQPSIPGLEWKKEAVLEAQNTFHNLKIIEAQWNSYADSSLQNLAQDYEQSYEKAKITLKRLALSDSEKAKAYATELLQLHECANGKVMGIRKAAIDYLFEAYSQHYLDFLNNFETHKNKDPWIHWCRFDTAKALAEFWIQQKCYLPSPLEEAACRAAAYQFQEKDGEQGNQAYIDSGEHPSIFSDVAMPKLDGKAFESTYKQAWEDLIDTERHLVYDPTFFPTQNRLLDAEALAYLFLEKYRYMRNIQEIAYFKAAFDYLSFLEDKKITNYERQSVELKPFNFFAKDVSGILTDHEGADKIDLRNRRADELAMRLDRDIYFTVNNYPPDRGVMYRFINELRRVLEGELSPLYKRMLHIAGPSSPSLDRVKRIAQKVLIALGGEELFTPNQEMHIKYSTGSLGSSNLDKASKNNSEVGLNSTSEEAIRMIEQQVRAYLQGSTLFYADKRHQAQENPQGSKIFLGEGPRVIALHLYHPSEIDKLLGITGPQLQDLIGVVIYYVEGDY